MRRQACLLESAGDNGADDAGSELRRRQVDRDRQWFWPVVAALQASCKTQAPIFPISRMIVTSGCGWVQVEDGPKEEIRPGDVIWLRAGEKHWHGATATSTMTHIAIAESLDGKAVDWMEKVTDEQYGI